MDKKRTTKLTIAVLSIVTLLLFAFSIGVRPRPTAHAEGDYRAIYVIDHDTGTVIASEHENDRYPIASMVKIMTLLLTFEELDKGNILLDEKIAVSEYASSMGGSQLFLDAGKEYPISDLIKGVSVCSANDAAVALGERISGNNDAFIEKMNKRATELQMNDTLFCNATGLPDSGTQYSTAKDVTTMMRNLLSHQKYYDYAGITLEDYVHPDGRKTQMVNTNKLIRSYPGCDAGKTGFTNEAMFCLSSTAKRGDTRAIVTILGCPDSKTRFRKVSDTFSYVFSNYQTKFFMKKGDKIHCDIVYPNAKGAITEVICDGDLSVFGKKGDLDNYSVSVTFDENIKAPISTSNAIGYATLYNDKGEKLSESRLYPTQDIDKKGFFDNFKHVIDHWKIAK